MSYSKNNNKPQLSVKKKFHGKIQQTRAKIEIKWTSSKGLRVIAIWDHQTTFKTAEDAHSLDLKLLINQRLDFIGIRINQRHGMHQTDLQSGQQS